MPRDFTFEMYRDLCSTILSSGFLTTTVNDFLIKPSDNTKRLILRHDVDSLPKQALEMAIIESEFNIKSTYYFRIKNSVFDKKIIKKIYNLGHEIGYHYEVLASNKGDKKKALNEFKINLGKFREISPITTICMHGSPLSSWTDSDLWLDNNFRDYGILGEAFLSINYNSVRYFTDTGRRWNGNKYNVRDKVSSRLKNIDVKSTKDLIEILPTLLTDISLNIHPQRWHSSYSGWLWENISQNIKNIGKRYLLRRNN